MKIFNITFLIFFSFNCIAQEVISTSGNNLSGTNVQVSYTIGETVIETVGDNPNQITQGFHQPVITIEGIEELDQPFDIRLYPNPTTRWISVECSGNKLWSIRLFDMSGKLLLEKQTEHSNARLDMSAFESGTYQLLISQDQTKGFNTYKIIKN